MLQWDPIFRNVLHADISEETSNSKMASLSSDRLCEEPAFTYFTDSSCVYADLLVAGETSGF